MINIVRYLLMNLTILAKHQRQQRMHQTAALMKRPAGLALWIFLVRRSIHSSRMRTNWTMAMMKDPIATDPM
jgi:hypothetical protein